MLDLAFLVLMIIVLLKSIKGDFNLLMCNITTVIGIVAAILGMIKAFFSSFGWFEDGILNILLFIIALLVKPAAKHFAKLYQDKIDKEIRSYYEQEKNAKENFFRKTASDNAYLHAAERGTNPPNANIQATCEIPQSYNGGMANNTAFPQNGNPAASPKAANNAVFPQNGNPAASPVVANSAAFPQTGTPAESPMAANSAAFPQNGNPAASPMAANSAVFQQNINPAAVVADSPKMEGISPISKITDTQPYDFGTDDNYGLPYDLSAPIDLDHGIDDISVDDKK